MIKKVLFRLGLAVVATAAVASAAPRLALRVPDALTRPIWVAVGSAGPTNLAVEAYNEGDGQLNLSASGGFPAWLDAQVGSTGACSFDAAKTCTTVRVVFSAAALERGVYHGEVTISSPGAVDAPQTLAITLYVGGDIPQSIDLYVPPVAGATDSLDFQTPSGPAPNLGVAGSFLSVSSNSLGSFRFLHDHRLIGRYSAGLNNGVNQGSMFIEGSSFAPDNRVVPVRLNVTSNPIGAASAEALVFETAEGITPPPQAIAVSNRGQGTLAINGVTAESDGWLSAEINNGFVFVAADSAGLAPGLVEGTVTITTNAVNSPHVIPVAFTVDAAGAPTAAFRGAVNGATFESTRSLAPLTIASVFGDQLSYGLAQAESLPLPTELGGARVFVNGVPAPLFFVSYGQINFQVPHGLSGGSATVRVERDGQVGNEILTHIAERSIGIFRFNRGEYGAIRNATQGNYPLPRSFSAPGFETAPARPGDVLEIFATGLGPVSPMVAAGEPAPSTEPLARVVGNAVVSFGFGFLTPQRTPVFVGLTPGFAGLFQVNIVVPEDAATNPRTPLVLRFPDGSQISNVVEIAIER